MAQNTPKEINGDKKEDPNPPFSPIQQYPVENSSPNIPFYKEIWQDVKNVIPMTISHHPICDSFINHTINIGKARFCIGCFIGYPSGIIGLLLSLKIFENYQIPVSWALILSLLLFSSQIWTVFHWTDKKSLKIIQKICMGLGGGSLIATLYSINYPFAIYRLLVPTVIIMVISIPILYLHYRNTKRVCELCANKWTDKCPSDFCFVDPPNNYQNLNHSS